MTSNISWVGKKYWQKAVFYPVCPAFRKKIVFYFMFRLSEVKLIPGWWKSMTPFLFQCSFICKLFPVSCLLKATKYLFISEKKNHITNLDFCAAKNLLIFDYKHNLALCFFLSNLLFFCAHFSSFGGCEAHFSGTQCCLPFNNIDRLLNATLLVFFWMAALNRSACASFNLPWF